MPGIKWIVRMNETYYPPLAIFAGGGDLPLSIIKHCQQQMRPFIVICFKSENYTYDFTNIPHYDAQPHGRFG